MRTFYIRTSTDTARVLGTKRSRFEELGQKKRLWGALDGEQLLVGQGEGSHGGTDKFVRTRNSPPTALGFKETADRGGEDTETEKGGRASEGVKSLNISHHRK